jgi:hypothetical protein
MKPKAPEASAENTAQEQRGVPFKPGQSGNPSGRPRGARSKLSEGFLTALQADFEQNGSEVIAKVRRDKPDVYLKVVANLMPARLEAQLEAKVDVHHSGEFGDANSIEEVLELVAREAGHEAAVTLAEMFGLEPPDSLTPGMTLLPPRKVERSYHPSACYNAKGQPVYCKCDEDDGSGTKPACTHKTQRPAPQKRVR